MTIRTYKPRRGRVTPRQQAAIDANGGLVVPIGAIAETIVSWAGPAVLEIGFGTGSATAVQAADDPATLVVAVDVHTPGIGNLLHEASERGLTNVRVVDGDALVALREDIAPGSLAGVRTYFPDPWPKARHHKRRLVTPANVRLVAQAVRPGGWWHLATDWADYAAGMSEAIAASGMWTGGVVERPADRPVTRYEQHALDAGRVITDLLFTRS